MSKPDPSDRRYSEWNMWQRVGVDSQDDRTRDSYPVDEVVTYVPQLDYRPGQRH
jgi:hypothetical protein